MKWDLRDFSSVSRIQSWGGDVTKNVWKSNWGQGVGGAEGGGCVHRKNKLCYEKD